MNKLTLKKYILIVDDPGAQLASHVKELKELGYEVAQVDDLERALSAVEQLERLSLVVVNCSTNPQHHEQFAAAVRALHPSLPVIWLADTYRVVTSFLKPSVSESPSDLSALTEQAGKLLHEEFYASDVVREVVHAAQNVLTEFGVAATRSEPYLKSNLTVLDEVNALIGFAGEGLSGHLVLSASIESMRALHSRANPQDHPAQYDDLEDLLGEMTNRIMGATKRVFETRALSFNLRTPSFVRGRQARYRNQGGSTSLAIEFRDDNQHLRLEFSIDRLPGEALAPYSEDRVVETGQIHFL
ncbi:MAG TPA: chemotaxis protein CheX [Polyangiaceae bacterium]